MSDPHQYPPKKKKLPIYQIVFLSISCFVIGILLMAAMVSQPESPPLIATAPSAEPVKPATVRVEEEAEEEEEEEEESFATAELPAGPTPESTETSSERSDPPEEKPIAQNDSIIETAVATEEEEVVVIENPPLEKTGGVGNPEKRLSAVEQVPDDVITDCEQYFPRELSDDLRVTAMDGPIKAGFSVEIDGLVIPWTLMTVPLLPGEVINVNVINKNSGRTYELLDDGYGQPIERYGQFLKWIAPQEPGIYCVRIIEKETEATICLHAAVMVPWDGVSKEIEGYKIGTYQDKPYKNNPRYNKPRGFIRITEKEKSTWLSPHFQVKQFLCKQQGGYPKFLLVEPLLLMKMETLIEKLNAEGMDVSSLYLTSAYRTPWYNKALGNNTVYSRHLYGDAADFFVDSNRDGRLDDLDKDGDVDGSDAKIIHKTVEEITSANRLFKGGLGFYSHPRYNTPFIHVDTRGYPARWYKVPDPPKTAAK